MTLAVGGAGATGLLVPWCSVNDCCEEGSCVPRKPPKTPNDTSATHDEMSNLEARRAFYGRPCPNVIGRPVITSEIGNLSVFVLLGWRFVLEIITKRDGREPRILRCHHDSGNNKAVSLPRLLRSKVSNRHGLAK